MNRGDQIEVVSALPSGSPSDKIEFVRTQPRSIGEPQVVSAGFDWKDAGIGAGLALALVLLGAGAALASRHVGRAQTVKQHAKRAAQAKAGLPARLRLSSTAFSRGVLAASLSPSQRKEPMPRKKVGPDSPDDRDAEIPGGWNVATEIGELASKAGFPHTVALEHSTKRPLRTVSLATSRRLTDERRGLAQPRKGFQNGQDYRNPDCTQRWHPRRSGKRRSKRRGRPSW